MAGAGGTGARRRLPGVFLRRQRRLESGPGPLLDLRAFRYPMFRLSLALLCIAMAALFSLIILLPLYLQNIRGLGTLADGPVAAAGWPADGAARPDRRPPVRPVRAARAHRSRAPAAWCCAPSASAGPRPTRRWSCCSGLHVLFSAGLAFLLTPSFTTGLNPLPPSLYSHGSAILTTLQQVSGAAGTALLVTVLAHPQRRTGGGGRFARGGRTGRPADRVPGGRRHRLGRCRAGLLHAEDGGGTARRRTRRALSLSKGPPVRALRLSKGQFKPWAERSASTARFRPISFAADGPHLRTHVML